MSEMQFDRFMRESGLFPSSNKQASAVPSESGGVSQNPASAPTSGEAMYNPYQESMQQLSSYQDTSFDYSIAKAASELSEEEKASADALAYMEAMNIYKEASLPFMNVKAPLLGAAGLGLGAAGGYTLGKSASEEAEYLYAAVQQNLQQQEKTASDAEAWVETIMDSMSEVALAEEAQLFKQASMSVKYNNGGITNVR